MNYTKGYLIVDENGKYVVGYVKENDSFKYIAYDKTERCALRPLKGQLTVTQYIERLYKKAEELGEHHQFSYEEICDIKK